VTSVIIVFRIVQEGLRSSSVDNLKLTLKIASHMHEWALAEAVILAASEMAEKEGLEQVTEVSVKIGELQGVELDIFRFALSQLRANKLRNAKFKIEITPAQMKCRMCGFEWVLEKKKLSEKTAEAIHFIPEVAHAYIRCPKCNSPDFEILEGRGIWLEKIKGEQQ
jgi:hydrogenase nickel incorporation protein HypA/HybF